MVKRHRNKLHVINIELSLDSEPHITMEFHVPVLRASALLAPLLSFPPQVDRFCTVAIQEFLKNWENVCDESGGDVECTASHFYQYLPLELQLDTYKCLIEEVQEMCGLNRLVGAEEVEEEE